ncbi:MAG: SLBB domain-containing protein, partial [Planctomycetaceae bacterium]|nr:SLBB domain-containing protein [Planctomycetaceae bacterium]
WVPAIAMKGGAWYRDLGVHGYKGARFFSVCGDLARPGVFEVPIGITLRELVAMAGGVRGGRKLKAFAPSGPSGGFLPAKIPVTDLPRGFEKRVPARFLDERLPASATHLDILDLELDLDLFRALNLMLGAGMVVYADGADMLDQAKNAAEFFRNESCGKCVPCRLGSQKMTELGNNIRDQRYDEQSFLPVEGLMTELQRAMEMSSICGLGMVVGNPLITAIRSFRQDVGRYLRPGDVMTMPDADIFATSDMKLLTSDMKLLQERSR